MLNLSKSRLYALIQAGIFPEPVRHESCKRPVFDADLQQKCLDIRQTGIGPTGSRCCSTGNGESRPSRNPPGQPPITEEQAELVEALKSLGMTAAAEDVQTAMRELYPNGWNGIDQGEVVRRVFLQLRRRK